MSAAFAPHDWIIAQAAPFDDDQWPYQTYANIVDYTMLMAYDQVDDQGPPGSLAGQDWYEKTLDKRMRQLPADSTIVCSAPGPMTGPTTIPPRPEFRRHDGNGARQRRRPSCLIPPPTIPISTIGR